MPAQSEQPEVDTSSAVWYMGIDFGTTGISAVLLNYLTGQQYPIYWSDELRSVNSQFATRSSGKVIFRLPAVTYSSPVSKDVPPERLYNVQASVVGSLASKVAKNQPGLFLENFKPYLKIAIPYYCPKGDKWEPILQLHNQQLVSLYWVRQALQELLATLTPKCTLPNSALKVGAVGLESETLRTVLRQLEGVVLGCPVGWGDTYCLNLREAVLAVKLVRHPEQVFFLEDAIAPILAGLLSANANAPNRGNEGVGEQGSGEAAGANESRGARGAGGAGGAGGENSSSASSAPKTPPWRGGTLVINAGAITTELALVDLPDDLQELTYSDFSLCSLPYAGNAIDQDVFCQLLYPQLSVGQLQQLSLPRDLELPLPGQSDKPRRDRLASLLQSSPLGQALLKAAGYLKLIVQHKDEFTLELGTEQWLVKRSDLESKVVLPFVQQLNRELNALLIKTGTSEQGVYQVLCVGGTAAFGTLVKWIQQRLPVANLIRDVDSPTGNWVAAGVASLPLYPQVLNRSQQQYSDYFLLLELLRAFPETGGDSTDRSYRLEEIMQKLERRGLNTGTCYERLVRLVEGQLPPGLVPSIEDDSLLSQASKQNLHESTLTATPQLFSKQDNHLYRPNLQQQESLRQYLDMLLSGIHQKFEEPLIVKLGTMY